MFLRFSGIHATTEGLTDDRRAPRPRRRRPQEVGV